MKELEKKRRLLRQSRVSTLNITAAVDPPVEPSFSQPTKPKAMIVEKRRPAAKPTDDNLPAAWHPSGLALFKRWDGRLVYLQCCILGCGRMGFKTVKSLSMHISRRGAHIVSFDTKGLYKSNAEAIEQCGQPVDEKDATPSSQDSSAMTNASLGMTKENVSVRTTSKRSGTQSLDNSSAPEDENSDEDGPSILQTRRLRAKRCEQRSQRKDANENRWTEHDVQDDEEPPTGEVKVEGRPLSQS